MKKFRKIMAVLVAAMMIMATMMPAWAAGADPTATNHITISIKSQASGQEDQLPDDYEVYTAYKIFDATKVATLDDPVIDDNNIGETIDSNEKGFAYSILDNDPWFTVLTTAHSGNVNGTNYSYTATTASDETITTSYFVFKPTVDTNNTRTKYSVELANGVAANETTAKAIAKFLYDFKPQTAVGQSITPASALETTAGYYLITSSLGENFILATTSMEITEKNSYPTAGKVVLDLDNSNAEASTTTATIGQNVTFKLKAMIPNSANQDVTLHDTLSNGLTLAINSFALTLANGTAVDAANYDVYYKSGISTKSLNSSAAKTAVVDTNNKVGENETFVVIIKEAYVKTLTEDTNFVVNYQAELDKDALTYTDVNSNTVNLTYSHFKTPDFTVNVKTFEVELNKVDEADNALTGAQFVLYRYDNDNGTVVGDPIVLKAGDDANSKKYYKVIDSSQAGSVTNTTIDLTTLSKAVVQGLGNGYYAFHEITTPDGYSTQPTDKVFQVDNANPTLQKVVNKTNAMLPNTGGAGTTVLYIVGGMLVILAGAYLFFSRKKTA